MKKKSSIGLTPEQEEKYHIAIERGYFKDYSVNWRMSTLSGIWLWKYPGRVRAYERFMEIVGHTPTWQDVTDKNLRLFVEASLEEMCQNSVKTQCAELKSIINEAMDCEEIPSKKFKSILTLKSEASEAVYLSRSEVERIHAYKPRSNRDKRIKQVFMIEILTGARHVDCERLTKENIIPETGTIHYVMKKTRKDVSLPLHAWLSEYLPDNADDICFKKKIYLMTFNRVIKRMCKACGIDRQYTLFRRGEEQTAPKWKFVSSHSARRTFATNLYIWGAELGLIMQMMGHSDASITLGYIKEKMTVPEKVLKFFNG